MVRLRPSQRVAATHAEDYLNRPFVRLRMFRLLLRAWEDVLTEQGCPAYQEFVLALIFNYQFIQ